MRHFDLVGTMDVEPILDDLKAFQHHFNKETWRQNGHGSPHTNTRSIFLRMPPVIDVDSVFNSLDVVNSHLYEFFEKPVKRICDLVFAKPARVMIVELAPAGHIPAHVDEGKYAEATDRYHLCLTTSRYCFMRIQDEFLCPNPGEIWWFDKHAEHEVINYGISPRIHLIVDCWKD